MAFRSTIPPLAAVTLAALLAAPAAHAQNTTYYRLNWLGGNLDGAPPLAVGPISVEGSFSSSGSESAHLDKGRFRAFSGVSNPVSGSVTPQITSNAGAELLAGDVQVRVDTALTSPVNIPVTLHTLLTGSLSNQGLTPFASSVTVRIYGGGSVSQDVAGTITLTVAGAERLGVLAAAPLTMVDQLVDFPLVLTAWPGFFNALDFSLSVYAGGTCAGTQVNAGTSDFMGDGWRFPTLTPAFEVPPGVHVTIPSMNIVDNRWVDPTAGVTPVATSGRLTFAALQSPARGTARFALALPEGGTARVEVFDVRGRRMATLLDGWQSAGRRELAWDGARGAGAGVYFVRATADCGRVTTRIVVVK